MKAFHMPALGGLSRLNVKGRDVLLYTPGQIVPTAHLRLVIGTKKFRCAALVVMLCNTVSRVDRACAADTTQIYTQVSIRQLKQIHRRFIQPTSRSQKLMLLPTMPLRPNCSPL